MADKPRIPLLKQMDPLTWVPPPEAVYKLKSEESQEEKRRG